MRNRFLLLIVFLLWGCVGLELNVNPVVQVPIEAEQTLDETLAMAEGAGYDSAYSGAQVDASVAAHVGRNTTIGDPGSDAELVTEQAVREALNAKEDTLTNSAGLSGALSDETGTGAAVFATSPSLVTPILGAITSGVGTALTALNGENIQNDTIDDDSIDWLDVTFADFTEQTAWSVFYSNTNGDVTELALGVDGTYLRSNGAAAAPTFITPGGSGDITAVLDCDSGDCDDLIDAPTAFASTDATPDVSSGAVFITANASATTITDFDTELTNGKIIFVIVNDGYTTFDFTASGLEGMSNDYLADTGDLLIFVYTTTDNQWHATMFPKTLNVTFGGFTANRALETDGSGNIEVSAVTDTELNLLDGKTDLASADGDIYTGTHDFGGADDLEIPNGNNPTTDTEGQIAHDTDDAALEIYSTRFSASVLTAPEEITLPPVIIYEPDEVATIDDEVPLLHFPAETYPHGVTIRSIHIVSSATCTDPLNFEEWSNNGTAWSNDSTVEAITLSGTYTEDDGTLADSAIAADAWLFCDLDDTMDDVAYIAITVTITINPGD